MREDCAQQWTRSTRLNLTETSLNYNFTSYKNGGKTGEVQHAWTKHQSGKKTLKKDAWYDPLSLAIPPRAVIIATLYPAGRARWCPVPFTPDFWLGGLNSEVNSEPLMDRWISEQMLQGSTKSNWVMCFGEQPCVFVGSNHVFSSAATKYSPVHQCSKLWSTRKLALFVFDFVRFLYFNQLYTVRGDPKFELAENSISSPVSILLVTSRDSSKEFPN